MVVLTVASNTNPTIIILEEALPRTTHVKLLSCSLPNSWDNVHETGKASIKDSEGNEVSALTFPPGHYSLENIQYSMKVLFGSKKFYIYLNQPFRAILIFDKEASFSLAFDDKLKKFMDLKSTDNGMVVKRLNQLTSYLIHCDLVEPKSNYFNGRKSTLLKTVEIRGESFERVHYTFPEEENFREAFKNRGVNGVTLSVKDENGELFNFNGVICSFIGISVS